jgi:hypothetical protein
VNKAKMIGEPGNERTHARALQRLRRDLVRQGLPAEKVDRIVEAKRAKQQAARDAWAADESKRRQVEEETYARLQLDDSKHRPGHVDPLLRGQARVTGATAAAVKRSKATTRFEYENGLAG